jgi:hypothetical protein
MYLVQTGDKVPQYLTGDLFSSRKFHLVIVFIEQRLMRNLCSNANELDVKHITNQVSHGAFYEYHSA